MIRVMPLISVSLVGSAVMVILVSVDDCTRCGISGLISALINTAALLGVLRISNGICADGNATA